MKFDIHFGHFHTLNLLFTFINFLADLYLAKTVRQYLEENQCEVNYNECMADKDLGPILINRIFGVRYSKVVYLLIHAMGAIVVSLVGFACYH